MTIRGTTDFAIDETDDERWRRNGGRVCKICDEPISNDNQSGLCQPCNNRRHRTKAAELDGMILICTPGLACRDEDAARRMIRKHLRLYFGIDGPALVNRYWHATEVSR